MLLFNAYWVNIFPTSLPKILGTALLAYKIGNDHNINQVQFE